MCLCVGKGSCVFFGSAEPTVSSVLHVVHLCSHSLHILMLVTGLQLKKM